MQFRGASNLFLTATTGTFPYQCLSFERNLALAHAVQERFKIFFSLLPVLSFINACLLKGNLALAHAVQGRFKIFFSLLPVLSLINACLLTRNLALAHAVQERFKMFFSLLLVLSLITASTVPRTSGTTPPSSCLLYSSIGMLSGTLLAVPSLAATMLPYSLCSLVFLRRFCW
jgi:hypothetical protein